MLPSIDQLLLGRPKTALQADIRDGLERYFAMRASGEVGDKILGNVFGDDRLKHENLELDTALKRKALGIPQDTEDFNEMTNMRKGAILASLGINLDKALDYPQQSFRKRALIPLGEGVEGVLDGGRIAGRAVLRRAVGGI